MMREAGVLIIAAICFISVTRCVGQDGQDDPIAYAPDIVGVDRLFMIAINVPAGAPEMKLSIPASVVLLDRTAFPTEKDQRRFYFRAVERAEAAQINFDHPDGLVAVPITVWSFDDLRAQRTLKGQQLPRRWPVGEELPELKDRQTATTEADREAAKASGPGVGVRWADMSDDDIWAMQPDMTIPRWHWVNVKEGCPEHGTEIYNVRAYYPWIKDTSFPYKWKIECPIGHETYPSNDFAAGDFTSGGFVDDGVGGACEVDGIKYGFIAELCQAYCHQMLGVAPQSAQAYLATGDVKYLHKTLVALCRLGVEHAYLATMTQHRHRNTQAQVERFGQGRFDEGPIIRNSALTVYGVDQPSYQWRHAEAYDKIWPDIDKDAEIIPFLQKQGYNVNTHEDVRRFIEENLFATWMQATMDGAIHSNEPYTQRGLARLAEVLNYESGQDFMEWLFYGEGKMRLFVPNTYFRDGAPYESTGGYNSMHVSPLGPIVESIEHVLAMRPETYPEDRYPSLTKSRRYQNVFDFCMDMVTIDRSFPQIGDTGGYPDYEKLPKATWHSASAGAFEHAYSLFGGPKLAWALANSPGWRPSKEFPFTREEIEAEASEWPDDWNDASSLHDGYGVAILRGGKGDGKRALWMRYGRSRSHTQDDIMDIGLDAFEGKILNHMGYPRNWGAWEPAWTSHHLARQLPYAQMAAKPEMLADAGIAHVAAARARVHPEFAEDGTRAERDPDSWQRRMLALVDVSDDEFYCVDFYRISGGDEHWWAFHCQEGEFQTEGLELTAQDGGTLAGADVPYGDVPWMKAHGGSVSASYGWRGLNFPFVHLYNVEKGQSAQPWSADWNLKTGEGLHVKLSVLQAAGADGSPIDVNVTDGKAASGGSPYEMKWIMMRNQAADLAKTQVLSLIEPYMNEPVILNAEPLALSGDDESGFSASACRIETANRTDTLFCAADGSVERVAGDFSFAGRFGLYAERDGQPVAMSLVGGTKLHKGDIGIELESPEYRGEIVNVVRKTETITVSPAPPDPKAMIGASIFITSTERRVGFKVTDAKAVEGGAELSLAGDSLIGTGKVTGVGDASVHTDTAFVLYRYGYYEGARLASADGSAEYRINEVRSGQAALIDAEAHPGATADVLADEFEEGSWFSVFDYGLGDTVVWPYSVSVERVSDGVYSVTAPCPVTVRLPDGTSAAQ